MSRIVVNPSDLRRGASRLRGVGADLRTVQGRVRSAAVPAMPADLLPAIQSGLESIAGLIVQVPDPLGDSAVELERRAFWAEIADELIAGVPLSAAQLREFMAGLRDGTLVRYAEPWQAELAGQYVGALYRDDYTEIPKLEELAALLVANGRNDDFSAGFVEGFGADNIAEIPRVLQAMTDPKGVLNLPLMSDQIRRDLAFLYTEEDYDWEYDRDKALEILGAFSIMLASATTSTRLDPSVRQALAYDGDRWALGQLVHEGRFGTEFLKDLFHSGVIAWIDAGMDDPRGVSMMPDPLDEGPTLVSDDHMLLIMEALARNNEASALALTEPIPEQFRQSLADYDIGERDAIKILYDHGDWNDRGQAFADVYRSGTDFLWANRDDGDNLVLGHELSQQLIDRTLDPLRWEIPTLTHALAQDLALHHMEDLQRGAFSNVQLDPDAGGLAGKITVGSTEVSDGVFLQLGNNELEDLLRTISEHDESYDVFLGGAADFQREWVADHVGTPTDTTWAGEVGAFNGVVMNAADLERFEDFDSDNSAHRTFFSFVNAGVGLIPNPLISTGGGVVVSIVEGQTGPDAGALIGENDDARQVMLNTAHSKVALAYFEAGLIDTPPPPVEVDEDGRPTADYISDLANWTTSDEVHRVIAPAVREMDRAWGNVDVDN
jgi:hypothetical protein